MTMIVDRGFGDIIYRPIANGYEEMVKGKAERMARKQTGGTGGERGVRRSQALGTWYLLSRACNRTGIHR